MRPRLIASFVGGALAALGAAPARAADAAQSAPAATHPADIHGHEADQSPARPAIDRAKAELPAVVVSAIPGDLPADRIVRPVGVLAGAELDDARAATLGQTVAGMPGAPYCVGFAAESENLLQYADEKRRKKKVPLLVGNIGHQTFGSDENELVLFDQDGHKQLPRAGKQDLARALVAEIAARLPR